MDTNKNSIKSWQIFTIVILLLIILGEKCTGNKGDSDNIRIDSTKVKVNIPEKVGKFEPIVNLEPIKQADTVFIKGEVRYKTKVIIDSTLYNEYKKVIDEKKKDSLYKDAITIRDYKQTFEDSLVKIDVDSKVRGMLLEQSLDYKLKPREVEVYEKTITRTEKTKFALYTGGQISVPVQIGNKPGFQLNLGAQDKKGYIYEIGYDSNNYVHIGIKARIFSIKR